jgi:predicted Zn-dependent protease
MAVRSLDPESAPRYLTRETCDAIWHGAFDAARGGGSTEVSVLAEWAGYVRWARNRPQMNGEANTVWVAISRRINGRRGLWRTDRIDPESIVACVRAAETAAAYNSGYPDDEFPLLGRQSYDAASPALWSDAMYALDAGTRSAVAEAPTAAAHAAGLVSAGYLEIAVQTNALFNSAGLTAYGAATEASYSTTVRTPDGTGSGWAGRTCNDWTGLDVAAVSARALQKCAASANPVAIEPGRYTVILEPQAVAQLLDPLMQSQSYRLRREHAESGSGPFAATRDESRIGQPVLDARISITSDPADPDMPGFPFAVEDEVAGEPLRATPWVNDGVLTALTYNRRYAVRRLRIGTALPWQPYRVHGGTTTMEQMIETTKRGLLVTRFNSVDGVGQHTLCSGTTRDGLWLIENGTITKAVKNLRFTESILFAFNNVDALGPSVRVHNNPAIVPPMKIRDFSFTSLSDAI